MRPSRRVTAILMPNPLGDFCVALSVVIGASRRDKDASIALIVPPSLVAFAGALVSNPVIAYPRDSAFAYAKSCLRVRAIHAASLVVLPHSFSSAVFGFITGIPHRRGIARNRRSFLLTDVLPRSTRSSKRHLSLEYATLLDTAATPPEVWEGLPFERDRRYTGSVVMCPGAAYGPAKVWGGFAELAGRIRDRRIVVLGDRREKEAADAVCNVAPDRIVNLAGSTSIVEAARIIAAASVAVSNDSGLMHVAGLLGTPVVGIFGSTRPSWTRPLGSRVRIATVSEPCSPCFDRRCKLGHYQCLRRLTVDSVEGFVRELLSEDRAGEEGRAR